MRILSLTYRLLSFASLILLGSLVPLNLDATTYGPPGPDPWYIMSLELDHKSLPAGVTIVSTTDSKSNPILKFGNSSNTPFYLLMGLKSEIDWLDELPRDVMPRFKAVSGKCFEWSFYLDGWGKCIEKNRVSPHDIRNVRSGKSLADMGPFGPNRPKNLEKEKLEPFSVYAYYKGKPFRIAGHIQMTWNDSYGKDSNVWYATETVFKTKLPKGIDFKEWDGFYNKNATPLFFVTKLDKPIDWYSRVPPRSFPCAKISREGAFNLTFDDEPRNGFRWETAKPEFSGYYSLKYLKELTGLKDHQIEKDNRPQNQKPPKPQKFTFKALYGNKLVDIKGKIIYQLNRDYRADASKGPLEMKSCYGDDCKNWPD